MSAHAGSAYAGERAMELEISKQAGIREVLDTILRLCEEGREADDIIDVVLRTFEAAP